MRAVACLALSLALASCTQFVRFDGGDDDDASGQDGNVVETTADTAIVADASDASDSATSDAVVSDAAVSETIVVIDAAADVVATDSSNDAQSDAEPYIRQCGTSCPSGYHWVSRSYDPARCGDSGGADNYIVCMRD